MPLGRREDIPAETVVYRVGGGSVAILRLSSLDAKQTPPGISVLLGGTAQGAAAQLRGAFPRSRKWRQTTHTIGTTTAAAIREAGFEIVPEPTARFPNHARLVHPKGVPGFSDENLQILAAAFQNTTG